MCLPDQAKGSTIQTIAVLVGNLLSLNFGITFGITPSHIKLYVSDNTPLRSPIRAEEATWISGCLFLSAALGSIVFGLISPKIGPKSVLLLCGLFQIIGWFSVHFAYDVLHIYSSRIFAGAAAGAAFVVMPLYISDISEIPNKAALTVSNECSRALGIVIGFALGSYMRYNYVSIIGICVSIVFSMTFPFVQESPFYYISKGNLVSFEKSLRWFRGIRHIDDRDNPEFLQEVRQIQNNVENQSQMANTKMSKCFLIKLLINGIILSVGSQLSGVYIILNNGPKIFESISLKFSIDINILILALVQLMGTVLSNWTIASFNRKISLFVTSFLSTLCLIATTLYLSFGDRWQINGTLKPWLLLILLSIHILFSNVGVFSIAPTVLTAILPAGLLSGYLNCLQCTSWLILFSINQFFQLGFGIFNILVIFWIFTFASLCVTIFSGFFLENTRNLSSDEIQHKMGFTCNGHIAKMSPTNGHFKMRSVNSI